MLINVKSIQGRKKGSNFSLLASKELNLQFFRGTLNCISSIPIYLDPTLSFKKIEDKMLWPARIDNQDVFLVRWENAPLHVYEILSIQRLHLKNSFTIEVPDLLIIKCLRCDIMWYIFWRFRESLSYKHDFYYNSVKYFLNLFNTNQRLR